MGALPPSYRWWLAEYGSGRVGGADVATVAPPEHADAYEAITAGWRLNGDRLCFAAEPDGGDEYFFVLGARPGAEHPVVRRDQEEPVADTFAGFLAVQTALATGLKDGPNPTMARLWRSTPGVLLDNGVHVYGPQAIWERNETFEVAEYAPGWVLIGDDSGGGGLFMRRHGRDRVSVFRLGLGAIEPDIEAAGERLTDDLIGWLGQG